MGVRGIGLALLVAMLAGAAGQAQLREMATDRPDVANSPTTIDAGHLQVELGVVDRSVERAGGVRERTTGVAESNLRLGVSDALELNVVLRPRASVAMRDGAGGIEERARGIGDTTVGAKLNFWGNDGGDEAGDTALGAQVQVNLPTAKRDLGAGKVEVALSLPFTLALPAGFRLSLQPTLSRVQSDGGRAVTGYQGAAAIDHDIGPINAYAEYVADETSEDGGPAIHVVNLGGSAALTDNLVLDAGIGLGLTHAADDFRFLTGISVRF